MARYTGPKLKLSRRSGLDLGLKTKPTKTARRLAIPPGMHGRRGRGKLSEFGLQLREKQKVKWAYGVGERQFRRYFERAAKTPAATGQELLKLLERRLDNVVYRLHFAPTRAAARQLVTHGHVKVDGKKLTIPSHLIKQGQMIQLSDKSQRIPAVAELLTQKGWQPPEWLERQAAVGRVKRYPEREEVDLEINEQLIVEHYSR